MGEAPLRALLPLCPLQWFVLGPRPGGWLRDSGGGSWGIEALPAAGPGSPRLLALLHCPPRPVLLAGPVGKRTQSARAGRPWLEDATKLARRGKALKKTEPGPPLGSLLPLPPGLSFRGWRRGAWVGRGAPVRLCQGGCRRARAADAEHPRPGHSPGHPVGPQV